MDSTKLSREKRINLLTEYNKRIYLIYEELLLNNGGNEKSKVQYRNVALNFLSNLDCNVSVAEYQHYLNYFKSANSDRNKIKRIDYIVKFLTLVDPNKCFAVKPDDFRPLRIKRKDIKARNVTSPLSVNEINEIRHYLIDNNKFDYIFTFELFYQYGLTLAQRAKLRISNIDKDNKLLIIDGQKHPLYENLLTLINEHPMILQKPLKSSSYSDHLSIIGVKINRRDGLNWQDIKKTRDKYFIRCSKCENLFPPDSKYFKLLQFENDEYESKWILCINCVDEIKYEVENEK